MTRREWLSVLAQARPEVLAALAAPVEASRRAEVIRPASRGLLQRGADRMSHPGSNSHPGQVAIA
jgi:alpha-D-ribose 1-methylphosphonate 5-triphosphate synthase subunit PhnG